MKATDVLLHLTGSYCHFKAEKSACACVWDECEKNVFFFILSEWGRGKGEKWGSEYWASVISAVLRLHSEGTRLRGSLGWPIIH